MIELERSRDLGALLRDSLTVYLRHFWTFLVLGALVVAPAELIVSGVGLEQLSSDYDATPSFAEGAISAAVSYLVVGPLVTAMCVHVLRSLAGGGPVGARAAIVNGFDSFGRIFFAVVLAALGIALGLIVIVPGVYLFVRWYFVPQAVVIEGARGAEALRESSWAAAGSSWRTFGLVVLVNVVALLVSVVVGAPFTAGANATDRAAWALAGQIVSATVTVPFAAVFSTLLYYDLRKRGR